LANHKITRSPTDLDDTACPLDAQCVRELDIVPNNPTAHADVREIDTGSRNLNDHLARACHRLWQVDHFHHFGTARAGRYNSFHQATP
jgi:hypothetical protein